MGAVKNAMLYIDPIEKCLNIRHVCGRLLDICIRWCIIMRDNRNNPSFKDMFTFVCGCDTITKMQLRVAASKLDIESLFICLYTMETVCDPNMFPGFIRPNPPPLQREINTNAIPLYSIQENRTFTLFAPRRLPVLEALTIRNNALTNNSIEQQIIQEQEMIACMQNIHPMPVEIHVNIENGLPENEIQQADEHDQIDENGNDKDDENETDESEAEEINEDDESEIDEDDESEIDEDDESEIDRDYEREADENKTEEKNENQTENSEAIENEVTDNSDTEEEGEGSDNQCELSNTMENYMELSCNEAFHHSDTDSQHEISVEHYDGTDNDCKDIEEDSSENYAEPSDAKQNDAKQNDADQNDADQNDDTDSKWESIELNKNESDEVDYITDSEGENMEINDHETDSLNEQTHYVAIIDTETTYSEAVKYSIVHLHGDADNRLTIQSGIADILFFVFVVLVIHFFTRYSLSLD